jgi:hypothetical protein
MMMRANARFARVAGFDYTQCSGLCVKHWSCVRRFLPAFPQRMHEKTPPFERGRCRQTMQAIAELPSAAFQLEPTVGCNDGLSVGLISGRVARRGFGMPFLASSLDDLVRNGPSSE